MIQGNNLGLVLIIELIGNAFISIKYKYTSWMREHIVKCKNPTFSYPCHRETEWAAELKLTQMQSFEIESH